MITSVLVVLFVFYAGAVAASGWSWLAVMRGSVGFSTLRDLTGIGDRNTLRRLFGLTAPDGTYRVAFGDVLRHRRSAGVILTDLPVHAMFLAALGSALAFGGASAAEAVACAAAAHALSVGAAGLTIFVRSRPLLQD